MAMDKSGNGTSTLSDSLRTVPQRVESFITPSSVEDRGAAARREIPALMKGKREAAAEQETLEFERDQEKIRKEADAERDVARGTRMAGKELETGLQKRGVFEAPQYKASDYAKNSATRMITAVLLGGIARTSAMGQLKAIESMQKAEQQGLADQFDAARLQFDEQEKQRQDNNKMLKDRFDRMIDLLSKDRNAALVEAKLIEGQLGKGIIATKLKAGLFYDAYDLAQKTFESSDRVAFDTRKQAAKGSPVGPDGRLIAPGYSSEIRVHPSGVPLAPIDPYEGIVNTKNFDAVLQGNQREKQEFVAKLRTENDKNVKTISSMNRAEAALKRMTQKAFKRAQDEGKIPKEATLNLDTMTVSGGNMPQVTGGVLGLPVIGEFMQQILTSRDPDASLFRAEAANYQRGSYVPGEGQISNFERQLFAQAAIDLGRPLLTNLELIRATLEADKRQQQRLAFFEDYFAVNRTLSGAERLWTLYSESNPFVTVDARGNYKYNPNTTDFRTWFASQEGQSLDQPRAQTRPAATSYNTEADADAAFSRGEIKEGDEVVVGGRRARYVKDN
jgi:hypothetical protein